MSRLFDRTKGLVLVATIALGAGSFVSGCADLSPPEPASQTHSWAADKPTYAIDDQPLCRYISDALAGKEAEIYQIHDSGGLLACVIGNQVVCVDDAEGVVATGVVPIVPVNQVKPVTGPIELDGTPLPADSIKGMISGNPSAGNAAPAPMTNK